MSIRERMRKLVGQVEEANREERAAREDAWLRSISEESLTALCDHEKAKRQATGDPEAHLTLEEIAGVLGMTLAELESGINPGRM
jgi:hypothetical protein